ncbi:MAG TPA: hypothetical protein VFT72_01580 [Opitutaceae bacterium]|nr:hypothetical protein [Opitutaceae bacterium]
MEDIFTGKKTCIRGGALPSDEECFALQSDHKRRLASLAQLSAAASRVGIGTDPDDDLVLWAEDELSLLQSADDLWSALATALVDFRRLTPIWPLETFGFVEDEEGLFSEVNSRLRLIGGGVEASAFEAEDHSIYKFYWPRENGWIGHSFSFTRGDDVLIEAVPRLGTYRDLFEKIFLVGAVGGMPTEFVGVSPEGAVIVKQPLGEKIPEGSDVTRLIPETLIGIPARFLRAHRDHPRLFFYDERAWLVADTHEKNLVRDVLGNVRTIDLLAAPWPHTISSAEPLLVDWLTRAALDPAAPLLKPVADDEL